MCPIFTYLSMKNMNLHIVENILVSALNNTFKGFSMYLLWNIFIDTPFEMKCLHNHLLFLSVIRYLRTRIMAPSIIVSKSLIYQKSDFQYPVSQKSYFAESRFPRSREIFCLIKYFSHENKERTIVR